MAAIALTAVLFGCASTRPVDVRGVSGTEGLAREVEAGDRVMVKAHDGRELGFNVVPVEADALVGEPERVERLEIQELEVHAGQRAPHGRRARRRALAVLTAMGSVFAAVAPAAILSASL